MVKKLGQKCSYCNPNSATAKRAKKEEKAVAQLLQDHGLVFQREVHISYSCLTSSAKRFARLDFVLELPRKRVVIEVDENQHKSCEYDIKCELSRMSYVMAAIACAQNVRNTLWIRFNPNAYTVDGVTVHVRKKQRYAQLLQVLDTYVPCRPMEVLYMYYDTADDGFPTICQESGYNQAMKNLLIKPLF